MNRPISDLMFRIVDDAVAGVASCSSVTSFAYLPCTAVVVVYGNKRVYTGVYTGLYGVFRGG